MEAFKEVYQWQFSPEGQGIFGAYYRPAVWLMAVVAAASLHFLMVILTKNSHKNPVFFRLAILGWALVFLHGVIAPFVPLNLSIPVVRSFGAICIAIFVGALAYGIVAIEIKVNHKPLVQIEVKEES